ncbi:hypothetical protein Tco_0304229 [Tanacetum coccineum]
MGWLVEDMVNYHLKELRCVISVNAEDDADYFKRVFARLSNKFGGFYFIFKFGMMGLLHQVITTIADRIRDQRYFQSKTKSSKSSMTFIPGPLDYTKCSVILASLPLRSSPKRSLKIAFQGHADGIGAEVNPVQAYYKVPVQVKTMKDPAWEYSFKTRRTSKTSSAFDALWKTLFMLYFVQDRTL